MDQSATAWELGLFQLVFAGGILALLLGKPPSRKRALLGITAAVSAWVGINAVAFGKVIIPELQVKRAIREWALPGRTFVDEKKSVLINLPEGWVMLPKDNPILPMANAEMIAVHSKSGCFAVLAIESIQSGVQSLDGYLDLVLRSRQKAIPNLVEVGRVDANLGKESGRRLQTSWQQEGQRFRGFTTACRDGWNYYLLSGWCIEEASAKAIKQFEPLESNFEITKSFSSQIEDPERNLAAEISYLSFSTIDRLMTEVVKRGLSVDQASRFGFEATNKGMKRLSQQEREEIAQIYAESFKALSPDDLSKWFSYARRAEAGDVFSPAERKEIGRLNNAAFGSLTGTWKVRLQALMGKAMELGFESE